MPTRRPVGIGRSRAHPRCCCSRLPGPRTISGTTGRPPNDRMSVRESVTRHHWRAFFSGGALSMTRLLTGFVRIKYVALVLGTAGVGFLSQATQLQLLGIAVASLSLAVGIINRMGAL